jgi:hypothetical protein
MILMKGKYFFSAMAAVMLIAAGCGSGQTEPDVPAAPNRPAIENVNGNIPDTSNSMNPDASLPVDSSRIKDSLEKLRP